MKRTYKKLPADLVLPRSPHVWPFKVYVQVAAESPEQGYREFTGTGGRAVGDFAYPLFIEDTNAETEALKSDLASYANDTGYLGFVERLLREFGEVRIKKEGTVKIEVSNARIIGEGDNLRAAITACQHAHSQESGD